MKRYKDTNLQVTKDGKVFGPRGERKINGKRYPMVSYRNTAFSVHRMVAELYVPNPNNLPQVDHIDGNKRNNHYTNLQWITASDNVKRAYDMGLATPQRNPQPGETNPKAKLTEKDVLTIRYLKAHGYTLQYIADEFGIDKSNVGLICNRKTWRHI